VDEDEGVGATGTGMCRGVEGPEVLALLPAEACPAQGESKEPGMCDECAGMGAHMRRDWFEAEVLVGRPFSRIKFASHSFRFSASLARGTAIGLLRVDAKRDWEAEDCWPSALYVGGAANWLAKML